MIHSILVKAERDIVDTCRKIYSQKTNSLALAYEQFKANTQNAGMCLEVENKRLYYKRKYGENKSRKLHKLKKNSEKKKSSGNTTIREMEVSAQPATSQCSPPPLEGAGPSCSATPPVKPTLTGSQECQLTNSQTPVLEGAPQPSQHPWENNSQSSFPLHTLPPASSPEDKFPHPCSPLSPPTPPDNNLQPLSIGTIYEPRGNQRPKSWKENRREKNSSCGQQKRPHISSHKGQKGPIDAFTEDTL